MTRLPTHSPGYYENYPPAPVASERPWAARAFGRGSVAGMVAAAATVLAIVPSNMGTDGALPVEMALVMTIYAVFGAVFGTVPGALVGGLLAGLARLGASTLPLRLLGGAAAAVAAVIVGAPLQLVSWPSTMVAALCGGCAARWVAWGCDRTTLA